MKEEDVKNYLRCFRIQDKQLNEKSKKIIDELFEYIKKRRIDVNKQSDAEYLKNKLKEFFDTEISFYNFGDEINFEFTTLDGYLGEFTYNRVREEGMYVDKSLNIFISLNSVVVDSLNYGLKDRLEALKYLFKCLSHEINHYRQFKLANSNICSVDNLRFAKEYLFSDEGFDTALYRLNHDEFSIEADADYRAYQRLSLLLDYKYIENISKCSVKQAEYLSSTLKIPMYKRKANREEEIDRRVSKILKNKNNRYLLKKFPILASEYDENGNEKKLDVLIVDLYKQIANIQKFHIDENDKEKLISDTLNMYYELIYKRLLVNNTSEIKSVIDLLGSENFRNILSSIKEYFRQDRIKKSMVFKRKHDIKSALDSELNYLHRSDGIMDTIEVRLSNGVRQQVKNEDYVKKYIKVNTKDKRIKEIIEKYVFPRIPECGYFVLKDGSRILPNDFINNVMIHNLSESNDLLDVINVFKRFVKSTTDTVFDSELESINATYQSRVSYLDKIMDTYLLEEGEMKL